MHITIDFIHLIEMSTAKNETTLSWALHKTGEVNARSNSKVNGHTRNVLKDKFHYNRNRKNFLRIKLLPLTKGPFLSATLCIFSFVVLTKEGLRYPVLTKTSAWLYHISLGIILFYYHFFNLTKETLFRTSHTALPTSYFLFLTRSL